MTATIFVIDDDAVQIETAEKILTQRLGYQAISALGGKAAIERFLLRVSPKPDVILLDLIMPEMSGVDVVRVLRRSDPHIPIIIMAPQENHPMSYEALNLGADECLQKPVHPAYLKKTIEKLLQRETMRQELERLSRQKASSYSFEDIIGKAETTQHMLRQARKLISSSVPFSIHGESGTGKELLARAIHGQSASGTRSFISVSCRRGIEHLTSMLEGEDGAVTLREAGTIFLRHIEQLDESAQQWLAEFLTRQRQSQSSIRFVVSSLQPLDALYRTGQLHEKLYFYFSGSTIAMPSLAERKDDIVAIATYYLKRYTATDPQMTRELSSDAQKFLLSHSWPGNLPELMRLMRRASYLCHEPILTADMLRPLMHHSVHLPIESDGASAELPGSYSLLNQTGEVKPFEQLEAEIIRFAIEHYGGKMTEVARRLGIGRSTLYRKMQDYKLKQVA